LASNLKNLSDQIGKTLDLIIKNADKVFRYELEAKQAAKKLEEANFKANIARRNMMAVNFTISLFLNFRIKSYYELKFDFIWRLS